MIQFLSFGPPVRLLWMGYSVRSPTPFSPFLPGGHAIPDCWAPRSYLQTQTAHSVYPGDFLGQVNVILFLNCDSYFNTTAAGMAGSIPALLLSEVRVRAP